MKSLRQRCQEVIEQNMVFKKKVAKISKEVDNYCKNQFGCNCRPKGCLLWPVCTKMPPTEAWYS